MDGSAPIASITISYLREQYSEGINAVIHGRRKERASDDGVYTTQSADIVPISASVLDLSDE